MDVGRKRIGGSDIGKILGVSQYGDALTVYERIVLGVEVPWNPLMARGAAMEPVMRAHGQNLMQLTMEPHTGTGKDKDYYAHPTLEFAHAQVDDLVRWQGVPCACDYKTVNRWAGKKWGRAGTADVPPPVRAQLAWEMLCVDRPLGVLTVGFGEDVKGPEVFVLTRVSNYIVERDADYERECVEAAREFWFQHVLTGIPPVRPKKQKRGAA